MLRFALATALLVLAAPARSAEPQPGDFVPGYTVTGRVLSEAGGKALPGVLVTLWNGDGLGRWTGRTNEKGEYSFSGVKPGDYYKVWIEERPATEAGVWSEAVVVQVKDRPVRAGDLFATLPQSLSGTVTDVDTGKPVAGAELNFSTADRNRDSVKTDDKGRFRLFVTPRDVDICCNGTDERYEPSEQRHLVGVGEGKHVNGTDLKVKSAPPFTGLVVNPDGKPAKAANVLVEMRWASPAGGGFGELNTGRDRWFKTDAEGRFTGYLRGSRGTTAVDLKVFARPLDHTTGGVATAKTTAKDEYRLDPIKVTLARSANILVRVVDPDGKGVPDSGVLASTHLWRDWSGLGGAVKDLGDGKYLVMGLIPGVEYHVWANPPGLRGAAHPETITLKPDETRELADLRLEWWGKKAVPGLIKKLQGANAFERDLALALLGELGAEAADAVPALVENLKNAKSNSVRFSAATALGKIGPPAKASVPDLIKALQEDNGGGVQREAATALGLIGEAAALPALKVASEHVDQDIRKAAAEAIKRLDEWAKKRPLLP